MEQYDPTRYDFPRIGWWKDHWWMLQGKVMWWLGYEFHLATQKGERTGYRKKPQSANIHKASTPSAPAANQTGSIAESKFSGPGSIDGADGADGDEATDASLAPAVPKTDDT